ncbi:hypothetical protein RRG08_019435 [Elysia crispata]|uniref:Secreted protein n=1 Tax=Elysia crispata TaxID=231223 RepID=A0AAE0Z329_9GAST|nr:hypothetical protein RRG08_019435 [Elysia crispata]
MMQLVWTIFLAGVLRSMAADPFNKTRPGDSEKLVSLKGFPRLLEQGKAAWAAVKYMALHVVEDLVGNLRIQYYLAKSAVEDITSSVNFESLLTGLIPLIDNEVTYRGCLTICHAFAKKTIDHVTHEIADGICPFLCRGAQWKFRQAAQTLEAELKDIDDIVTNPVVKDKVDKVVDDIIDVNLPNQPDAPVVDDPIVPPIPDLPDIDIGGPPLGSTD